MLYRRGKIWWAHFTVDGRRFQLSTKETVKTRAQRRAAELLAQAKGQSDPILEPMTLKEVCDRWWIEHYLPREPRHQMLINVKSALERLTRELGPDIRIDQLNTGRITRWKSDLLERGLGASTINLRLNYLSRVLHFAQRLGALGPTLPRLDRLKTPPPSERTLTPGEIHRLMSHAPDHLADLILLLTETAMRLSEAVELTWGNVVLPNENKRGSILVRRSKNGKPRTIPMTSAVAGMLKRRYRGRRNCDFVISYKGKSIRYPDSSFITARRKAGLGPDVTIHRTRHTAITRMIQAGVHPFVVGRIAGQTGTSIVERYSHIDTRDLELGIAALENSRD